MSDYLNNRNPVQGNPTVRRYRSDESTAGGRRSDRFWGRPITPPIWYGPRDVEQEYRCGTEPRYPNPFQLNKNVHRRCLNTRVALSKKTNQRV